MRAPIPQRASAAALLVALLGAGCGEGDGEARLDTAEIERGMQREIERDNPGTRVVEVTCPEEVERGKGIVFRCMVRGAKEGELAEATVTQVDDDGNVRYVVP